MRDRDSGSKEILDGNVAAFEQARRAGGTHTLADAQQIVVDTIEAMERRTLAHVVVADLILRLACRRAGAVRPIRLLEVASGNGWLLESLWRRARRHRLELDLVGSDLNPTLLAAVGRRLAAAGVPADLRLLDAHDLSSFPDGAFHAAAMTFTLHHLEPTEIPNVFAELDRVSAGGMINIDLRRGLLALGLVPNLASAVTPRMGRGFARHDAAVSVRRSYRPDELRRLVEAARLAGRYRVGLLPVRHPQALVAQAVRPLG